MHPHLFTDVTRLAPCRPGGTRGKNRQAACFDAGFAAASKEGCTNRSPFFVHRQETSSDNPLRMTPRMVSESAHPVLSAGPVAPQARAISRRESRFQQRLRTTPWPFKPGTRGTGRQFTPNAPPRTAARPKAGSPSPAAEHSSPAIHNPEKLPRTRKPAAPRPHATPALRHFAATSLYLPSLKLPAVGALQPPTNWRHNQLPSFPRLIACRHAPGPSATPAHVLRSGFSHTPRAASLIRTSS